MNRWKNSVKALAFSAVLAVMAGGAVLTAFAGAASAPSLPDLAALCLLPQTPRNRRTCAVSLAQCRSDQTQHRFVA